MPFKKGEVSNSNGRPKGTQNRTTKEAKETLQQILLGQIDNIASALTELRGKDSARYLDSCSKLFTYVLPKKTDITTDDKPIVNLPDITITTNDSNSDSQ